MEKTELTFIGLGIDPIYDDNGYADILGYEIVENYKDGEQLYWTHSKFNETFDTEEGANEFITKNNIG